MTSLLVALSILEIVVGVAVVVVYLVAIARSLRRTAVILGKTAFGVRAIETQCEAIGPGVLGINARVEGVAAALAALTCQAGARAGGRHR